MTVLLRDELNRPMLPVRWIARPTNTGDGLYNLHVQIAGHPGNRDYGYAFDVKTKSIKDRLCRFSLEDISAWDNGCHLPSLAGSGKQYVGGYLVYVENDQPELTTAYSYHMFWPWIGLEGQEWLVEEIKLKEAKIKEEEAKIKEQDATLSAQILKVLGGEPTIICDEYKPQQTTKGVTMKTKKFTVSGKEYTKCRWILVDGFEKGLHIQVKGPEQNRPYGLSLTIPFSAFEDKSDNYAILTKHIKNDTNSLRDGVRPYTKGGVRVATNKAGQRALQFIASRKSPAIIGLSYVTECGKVFPAVLDWIEQN